MSSSSSNYYLSLLKLVSDTRRKGHHVKRIHARIIRTLIDPESFLLNNLVHAYGKIGSFSYARHVFDGISHRNMFSWNNVLFAYSKSGRLPEMEDIFKRLPCRDGVSWNLFISGYASKGLIWDAVKAYNSMMKDGLVNLTRVTFSTMLILCSSQGRVNLGRQIHGQIVKLGFETYVFVGSPLIDMYAKLGVICDAKRVFDQMQEIEDTVMCNTMITGLLRCGKIEDAKRLFGGIREKDSISWTTMITGLTQNGLEREAVEFFRLMRMEEMAMDQFTFGSVLTACGGLSAIKEGKQIHAYILRTDHQDNIYVGSALVDTYCKCKNIKYAEAVFEKMRLKNVVTWTAILVGYGQNGFAEEAVRIFRDMRRNEIDPDEFTLGSVVSSCANIACLEEGTQFHGQAIVSGLLSYITVSNALVTLYGKCGNLDESTRLFDEMSFKDEVSWTALVSGYAQFGKANETIRLFERMVSEGLKPDEVTFIGVISACSRAGLVEEGNRYFESMVNEYRITPNGDHYTCMIDLFSRAGRLDEAKSFINRMPFPPDAIGWATLLSSCRNHGNLEIGKWAAESLLQIEPNHPAGYILLSSIYAAKGKWESVAVLRKGMRERRVRKEPGCSWIKHKGKLHIFSAHDKASPFSEQIYTKLEELNKKMIEKGYKPDVSTVLHDVEESVKINMLNCHSERLAIAFGLLFIPPGLPIRIAKNLRVCVDCHTATKYISEITGREILVRDSVRFHLFKDGTCSCGDFW